MEGLWGCCEAILYVSVRGGWVGGLQREGNDEVNNLCCSQNVIDVATQGQGECGAAVHSGVLCVMQLDASSPHPYTAPISVSKVWCSVSGSYNCTEALPARCLFWHLASCLLRADSHLQLLLSCFGWRPIPLFWWIPTPSVAWRSVTYSAVIIPGKLCHFVLGYHQYFPVTKAVLRRTGLFHSRVLAAALSVSACHIDFLRNRQHCVLLRKCYIRGAIRPPPALCNFLMSISWDVLYYTLLIYSKPSPNWCLSVPNVLKQWSTGPHITTFLAGICDFFLGGGG